jgi:hypothetical protein
MVDAGRPGFDRRCALSGDFSQDRATMGQKSNREHKVKPGRVETPKSRLQVGSGYPVWYANRGCNLDNKVMQSKVTGRIPLTFLLAMGVESLGVSFDASAAAGSLHPGVLAPLVEQAVAADTDDHSVAGKERGAARRQQLAQYFPNFPNFPNFFNCFFGNFRRC